MSDRIISDPELGERLPPTWPSEDAVTWLRRRRSTPADFLSEPGPDSQELSSLLTIAARVPDHRRVTPFRFLIFQGEARERFGDVLKTAYLKNEPDAEEKRLAVEEHRFMRAPTIVAVVSRVDRDHRTPEWEQVLTAGAVCENLLLAAGAHGYAAQWLTEWYAYDSFVTDNLRLDDGERIAGFVYIGTAKEDPKERGRPDLESIISYY
ncbi:MAG: nitroreductase [Pseudomonadota bacterium]